MSDAAPVVTLSTGVRVANFSSPHEFTFTDGSVLPACSDQRARWYMLKSDELETDQGKWVDIELQFFTSADIELEISALEKRDDIDIILVPFPVLEAHKQLGLGVGKCRVCRMADRVSKMIYHDRFCV